MRRTHTIGVLLPDLHGEFFSEVIRGSDQIAQQHGFHVLISGSHNQPDEVEAAVIAMRGRVDGLILFASGLDVEVLARQLPDSVPVVLINADHDGSRYDAVSVDNFGGAVTMTRYLLQLGHRRLCMIRGPEHNRDAGERERGFRTALADADIRCPDDWVISGHFTETSGCLATQALLAGEHRPTAIFAANDAMAVGALYAARRAGLRVPADVTIVGFDDIPIAEYLSPSLTTVRVAKNTLGEVAAVRLMDTLRAGNRNEGVLQRLPTELVVRGSSAEPGSLDNQEERT